MSKVTITLTIDGAGDCHTDVKLEGDYTPLRDTVLALLNTLASEQAKEKLKG